MLAPDNATIQALRRDLALQVARWIERRGLTQVAAAKQLGIPQPTVSKLMNGRVAELSLEFLIRLTVRAGLPVVLQTGKEPAEAGAFVSGGEGAQREGSRSRVAEEAREASLEMARRLSPGERLETQLRHNELVTALYHAGRAVKDGPLDRANRVRRAAPSIRSRQRSR